MALWHEGHQSRAIFKQVLNTFSFPIASISFVVCVHVGHYPAALFTAPFLFVMGKIVICCCASIDISRILARSTKKKTRGTFMMEKFQTEYTISERTIN